MEHTPFAFFLIEKLRPRILVELGTQYGTSYFAFCQAISELKLSTKAYGVDIWLGTATATDIFQYALKINNQHYAHFSNLLQMTFDEALVYFNDDTIDVLHIDGMHDYASVRHDFDTWLPKMSPSGVIIFHDSNVRENGFGVWKLYEEIKNDYPSFEFLHGHGLAVVCTGPDIPSDFLVFLENAQHDAFIQHLFASLGKKVSLEYNIRKLQSELTEKTGALHEQQFLVRTLQQQKNEEMRVAPGHKNLQKERADDIVQLVAVHQTETPNNSTARRFPFGKLGRFMHERRLKSAVLRSGLFDKSYYLQHNPDVAASGSSAVMHYVKFGGFEGRKPCSIFDSAYYLNAYPDVKSAGMNPLLHFIAYGRAEGRRIS
ncbi:MAG: hypothetical protein RIQ78_569 [Bacteroidota bacterium]